MQGLMVNTTNVRTNACGRASRIIWMWLGIDAMLILGFIQILTFQIFLMDKNLQEIVYLLIPLLKVLN